MGESDVFWMKVLVLVLVLVLVWATQAAAVPCV
jgi:hypothetical protein